MSGKLVSVLFVAEAEDVICVVNGKFCLTNLDLTLQEADGILCAPHGPLSGETAFTDAVVSLRLWISVKAVLKEVLEGTRGVLDYTADWA